MSRLHPRTAFAASFVLVAACGGGDGVPLDGNPPTPDAEIDAELGTENPPPPCSFVDVGGRTSCGECYVQPPGASSGTDCAEQVCETDGFCCASQWDEVCTELADAICPDARCADTVSFGGFQAVTLGFAAAPGFTGQSWSYPDLLFHSVAWADVDRDGDADAATASECAGRVLRNDGWNAGSVTRVGIFEHRPVANCTAITFDQRWLGKRARWADVERDGDLDAVFAGARGMFVARQFASNFELGVEIVPAARGVVTDFALHDVDGDLDLDAIVSLATVGTRVFAQTAAGWIEDPTWTGPEATSIELCDVAGDQRRELIIAGDALNGFDLVGAVVGDATFPPVAGGGRGVTCVVDPNGKDLMATIGNNTVRVFDGTGAQVWSSVADLEPDVTFQALGLDAGDLDGDGDVDLVVGDPSVDAGFHVFTREAVGYSHSIAPDLLAGSDTRSVELVWLGVP